LCGDSTILGNIIVGDAAIVAAKSIVTKSVPPFAHVSGIPAKVIGYLNKNNQYDVNY